MGEIIGLLFAGLYGLGTLIYRAAVRRRAAATARAAALTPRQQAIADAESAARPAPPAPPTTAASPEAVTAFQRREQDLKAEAEAARAYFRRREQEVRAERDRLGLGTPPPAPPAFVPPPVVGREATTADFESQEQALQSSEPARLRVMRPAAPPPPLPKLALSLKGDDLLRAVILQEVLGPPLSRRPRLPRS